MFLSLVYLAIAVSCGSIVWGYYRHRDAFHPLVYLGAMLAFLYGLLPLYLHSTGRLYHFIGAKDLIFVQSVNLVGVIALLLGAARGGMERSSKSSSNETPSLYDVRRLRRGATLLGLLGILGFAYMIANVGGLDAAYGRAFGGGWADLGYVRELPLLSLPAFMFLIISYRGRRLSARTWLLMAVIASPLIIHGLLGARRGPTFMVVVGLAFGWFVVRGRRPRLVTTLASGTALGLFLLFLVTNRTQVYLGSDFSFRQSPFEYLQAGPGNEYIYGAANVLDRAVRDQYWWGRRYLVMLFVRPVPRAIWRTKYEDAANLLGVPNLEDNMGLGTHGLLSTVGWVGARGAAPGIVADLWTEFWWFAPLALFVIGWLYGRAWARANASNGLSVLLYGLMLALSVYLVMQTFEAVLFRFLFMSIPAYLVWRYAISPAKAHSLVKYSN